MTLKRSSSRTPSPNPHFYRKQIGSLAEQATALANQDQCTERDLAISYELNQQYIDLLDQILDEPLLVDETLLVKVDDQIRQEQHAIKFNGIDEATEWILDLLWNQQK